MNDNKREDIHIFGKHAGVCKYGENGWQQPAGLFSCNTDDPLALDKFAVIEGTAPSYNNICDLDRLLQTMTHIAAGYNKYLGSVPFIAVGVKHGNACGAAVGFDANQVLKKMLLGDPRAIFGGLVMTNFYIDRLSDSFLAELLHEKHLVLDGIVAPDFSPDSIEKLKRKNDKCRFMTNKALLNLDANSLDKKDRFRYVRGGFLSQPNYTFVFDPSHPELKEIGTASLQEQHDVILAWAVGSTSNSNTVTLVKGGQLIGNGVGQQDRVGAAQLAIVRAIRSGHSPKGAVAYSDSFFPFPDGPQALIEAGITAILTTSGSVRDPETIAACVISHVTLYMIPDALARGFFGH